MDKVIYLSEEKIKKKNLLVQKFDGTGLVGVCENQV